MKNKRNKTNKLKRRKQEKRKREKESFHNHESIGNPFWVKVLVFSALIFFLTAENLN